MVLWMMLLPLLQGGSPWVYLVVETFPFFEIPALDKAVSDQPKPNHSKDSHRHSVLQQISKSNNNLSIMYIASPDSTIEVERV